MRSKRSTRKTHKIIHRRNETKNCSSIDRASKLTMNLAILMRIFMLFFIWVKSFIEFQHTSASFHFVLNQLVDLFFIYGQKMVLLLSKPKDWAITNEILFMCWLLILGNSNRKFAESRWHKNPFSIWSYFALNWNHNQVTYLSWSFNWHCK